MMTVSCGLVVIVALAAPLSVRERERENDGGVTA